MTATWVKATNFEFRTLNLCLLGNFACFFAICCFFLNLVILKGIQKYQQCLKVQIQIRPNILSTLIWVRTVCKGYQQMTLVEKELKIQI